MRKINYGILFALIILIGMVAPAHAFDLNYYYFGDWKLQQDVLKTGIVSEIVDNLADTDYCDIDAGDIQIDLSKMPAFDLVSTNVLKLRMPMQEVHPEQNRRNYYSMHATFDCGIDIDFYMYFALKVTFSDQEPVITVDILERDITDVTADILSSISQIFGGRSLEQFIIDKVKSKIANNFDAFLKVRYAQTSPPLQTPSSGERYTMISSDSILSVPDGAMIDIQFVSDGYTNNTIGNFDAVVAEFERQLGLIASEPFTSYKSAFRLFVKRTVIPATEANDPDSLHRIITVFKDDGGTYKAGLNNVKAFIGDIPNRDITTSVYQLGELDPSVMDIVVVISDATPLLASIPAGRSVRANAAGRLVKLPTTATAGSSSSLQKAATIIFHELGHTVLGDLADEYGKANGQYMGPEPWAVNVSRNSNSRKWANHTDRNPQQGAFDYRSHIYRPYDQCRMRSSSKLNTPFCAVCRESIVRGINRSFVEPYARVRIESRSPYREIESYLFNSSNSIYPVNAYADESIYTDAHFSLEAANIPEPWDVRWRIIPYDNRTGTLTFQGRDVDLHVYPGDVVEFSVESQNNFVRTPNLVSFTGPTGRFAIEGNVRLPARPEPPTSLTAIPRTNPIPTHIDPDSGIATSALALNARRKCYADFYFQCRIEWRLSKQEDSHFFVGEAHAHDDDMAPAVMPGFLPAGTYEIAARTIADVYGRRSTSRWVTMDQPITMGALGYQSRPALPGGPNRLSVFTCDDAATLSATTWDVNQDPVRLEFEIRPENENFTGIPTVIMDYMQSGDLSSSTDLIPNIHLRQSTTVIDYGRYQWQVRARSRSKNRPPKGIGRRFIRPVLTPWVQGPSFLLKENMLNDCQLDNAVDRMRLILEKMIRPDLRDVFDRSFIIDRIGNVPCRMRNGCKLDLTITPIVNFNIAGQLRHVEIMPQIAKVISKTLSLNVRRSSTTLSRTPLVNVRRNLSGKNLTHISDDLSKKFVYLEVVALKAKQGSSKAIAKVKLHYVDLSTNKSISVTAKGRGIGKIDTSEKNLSQAARRAIQNASVSAAEKLAKTLD